MGKKPRKSSTVSRKSSIIPSAEISLRKSSIARESLGKNNHSSLDDNEDGSESESSDELLIELSDSSEDESESVDAQKQSADTPKQSPDPSESALEIEFSSSSEHEPSPKITKKQTKA